MQHVTLEQAADLIEAMSIVQTIDSGSTLTHHGDIAGQPTIIISTCRGQGECYILQA